MSALLPSPIKSKSLRVFIVEDHADTTRSHRSFLEGLGHVVPCAGSMDWVWKELPRAGCDVVLCGIMLPDGDDWSLWRQFEAKLPRAI